MTMLPVVVWFAFSATGEPDRLPRWLVGNGVSAPFFPAATTTLTASGVRDAKDRYKLEIQEAFNAAAQSETFGYDGTSEECEYSVNSITCPPATKGDYSNRMYSIDLDCDGCGVFLVQPDPNDPTTGGMKAIGQATTLIRCYGGKIKGSPIPPLPCGCWAPPWLHCKTYCPDAPVEFTTDQTPITIEYRVHWDAATQKLVPSTADGFGGGVSLSININYDKDIQTTCWITNSNSDWGFWTSILDFFTGFKKKVETAIHDALSNSITNFLDSNVNDPVAVTETFNNGSASAALTYTYVPRNVVFSPSEIEVLWHTNLVVVSGANTWIYEPTPDDLAYTPPLSNWVPRLPGSDVLTAARFSEAVFRSLLWAGSKMQVYHYDTVIHVKDATMRAVLKWATPTLNFTNFTLPDGETTGRFNLTVNDGFCEITCLSISPGCNPGNVMFRFTFSRVFAIGELKYAFQALPGDQVQDGIYPQIVGFDLSNVMFNISRPAIAPRQLLTSILNESLNANLDIFNDEFQRHPEYIPTSFGPDNFPQPTVEVVPSSQGTVPGQRQIPYGHVLMSSECSCQRGVAKQDQCKYCSDNEVVATNRRRDIEALDSSRRELPPPSNPTSSNIYVFIFTGPAPTSAAGGGDTPAGCTQDASSSVAMYIVQARTGARCSPASNVNRIISQSPSGNLAPSPAPTYPSLYSWVDVLWDNNNRGYIERIALNCWVPSCQHCRVDIGGAGHTIHTDTCVANQQHDWTSDDDGDDANIAQAVRVSRSNCTVVPPARHEIIDTMTLTHFSALQPGTIMSTCAADQPNTIIKFTQMKVGVCTAMHIEGSWMYYKLSYDPNMATMAKLDWDCEDNCEMCYVLGQPISLSTCLKNSGVFGVKNGTTIILNPGTTRGCFTPTPPAPPPSHTVEIVSIVFGSTAAIIFVIGLVWFRKHVVAGIKEAWDTLRQARLPRFHWHTPDRCDLGAFSPLLSSTTVLACFASIVLGTGKYREFVSRGMEALDMSSSFVDASPLDTIFRGWSTTFAASIGFSIGLGSVSLIVAMFCRRQTSGNLLLPIRSQLPILLLQLLSLVFPLMLYGFAPSFEHSILERYVPGPNETFSAEGKAIYSEAAKGQILLIKQLIISVESRTQVFASLGMALGVQFGSLGCAAGNLKKVQQDRPIVRTFVFLSNFAVFLGSSFSGVAIGHTLLPPYSMIFLALFFALLLVSLSLVSFVLYTGDRVLGCTTPRTIVIFTSLFAIGLAIMAEGCDSLGRRPGYAAISFLQLLATFITFFVVAASCTAFGMPAILVWINQLAQKSHVGTIVTMLSPSVAVPLVTAIVVAAIFACNAYGWMVPVLGISAAFIVGGVVKALDKFRQWNRLAAVIEVLFPSCAKQDTEQRSPLCSTLSVFRQRTAAPGVYGAIADVIIWFPICVSIVAVDACLETALAAVFGAAFEFAMLVRRLRLYLVFPDDEETLSPLTSVFLAVVFPLVFAIQVALLFIRVGMTIVSVPVSALTWLAHRLEQYTFAVRVVPAERWDDQPLWGGFGRFDGVFTPTNADTDRRQLIFKMAGGVYVAEDAFTINEEVVHNHRAQRERSYATFVANDIEDEGVAEQRHDGPLRVSLVKTISFLSFALILGCTAYSGTEIWKNNYTRNQVDNYLNSKGYVVDKNFYGLRNMESAWDTATRISWGLNVGVAVLCLGMLYFEFGKCYRVADMFACLALFVDVFAAIIPTTLDFATLLHINDILSEMSCAPQFDRLIKALLSSGFSQAIQFLVALKLGPLIIASSLSVLRAANFVAILPGDVSNDEVLCRTKNAGVLLYRLAPLLSILITSQIFLMVSQYLDSAVVKMLVVIFWAGPLVSAQLYRPAEYQLNYVLTVWVLYVGTFIAIVLYIVSLYSNVWSLLRSLIYSIDAWIYLLREIGDVLLSLRVIGQAAVNNLVR